MAGLDSKAIVAAGREWGRNYACACISRLLHVGCRLLVTIRLSPRDPRIGLWLAGLGDAELGLGHLDAAIDEYHKGIEAGWRAYQPYRGLAAAYALDGKMEEAASALAEARRLNPELTIKWSQTHSSIPPLLEGLRKAGLPDE